MRYGFLLLLLLTLVLACETLVSGAPDPDPVEIRVENVSASVMEDVLVWFPDQRVVYGDVEPGGTTAYEVVGKAYRYAYVETVVQGDTLALQPIDYVGESLLDGGRYTYRLNLFEGRSLGLELVED